MVTQTRRHWIAGLLAGLSVFHARPLRADTFYVAPNASDSNPGTEAAPFASMERAQSAASPGDTIYFRGGTYTYASSTAADGVLLNKSGQSGKPIQYQAYAGETPVFDFSGMSAMARITGFRVTASFVELKGLELKGVPQNLTTQHESWGIYNTGSNNVFELLNLHHNMGPGLFIAKGGNNLVLNCDSHHNYDPKSSSGDGTNADGFGCHVGAGDTGNVIRGCRAWSNSDDGYDLIQAQVPVTIENSWAWKNGYQPDTSVSKGDGNGFKAGGYGVPATNVPASPPTHTVRFCLAFSNKASGFYANHHPVADTFYNNTAYDNGNDFNMLGLNGNVGILRNNLAYKGNLIANNSGIDTASNSWELPVMVSDTDFASVATAGLDAPRKPDGGLPDVAFMHLQEGSDLIDKGQDVGLPFNGSAPDLGAFEFGPPLQGAAGGGGASGSTGASGASGAGGSGGTQAGAQGGAGAPGGAGGAVAITAGAGGQVSAGGAAPSASSGTGRDAGVVGQSGGAGAVSLASAGAGVSGAPPSAAAHAGCACTAAGRPRSGRTRVWLACAGLTALGALRSRRRLRQAAADP